MSLWSCELGAGHTYDIVIDWRRAMALLQSGQVGDVNEIRYGMTILYQAVVHRKLAAIEALLRHGADINLGRQARSSHFEVVAAMTQNMDCIFLLSRLFSACIERNNSRSCWRVMHVAHCVFGLSTSEPHLQEWY